MDKDIRVRFAPSPTGAMHLGNIRVALMNYLFARQKNGKFILRIEDTDSDRNIDEAGLKILKDLKWLKINFDEGPIFQSDRTKLYQEQLDDLIANQKVYRCFCTQQELEQKRREQLESGLPPRYGRTCLHFSSDKIKQKIAAGEKFIWRFKINDEQVFSIKSICRESLVFEMKNFSDFALTRSDGSFTFLFANFVDDWLMKITHVIRGEDHISNTAMQAALFDAFAVPMPVFWHMPIICNQLGKKLSKRDFGFTLGELKDIGFLPEAICNYLAVIGGSFKEEVQSIDYLTHNFDFGNISSTGSIKYDVEKLRWLNHKWIEKINIKELVPLVIEFISDKIDVNKDISEKRISFLINKVKGDCKILLDFVDALKFCFEDPSIDRSALDAKNGQEKTDIFISVLEDNMKYIDQRELFLDNLKDAGKYDSLSPKEIFGPLRYILTGKFQGLSIIDILKMLDSDQIVRRLNKI